MKHSLKKIAMVMVLLLVMMLPLPVMAAGSAGISPSASTVTVGKSVNVTFSFSGGDAYIAGVKAYVSYDAAKLNYTGASGDGDANVASGSGTIVLETSSTSKTNLSITLSFTTQAVGDATVSITGSDIVDWNGNTIGAPTASKTITIKEKEAPKPPAESGGDKQESSEVEEPSDLETALKVQVNGGDLLLWTSLKNVTLPQDYKTKTIVYEGEQVEAAYHETLDLTLLYFTNSEGANGQFYVYNGFNAFYVYKTLTIGDNTYVLIMPGEEVVFPEGYVQSEEVIHEEAVTVWANPADTEYCYLYAIHQETEQKALYLYDRQENTLQRVNVKMYDLLIQSEQEPEEVPEEQPEVLPTVKEEVEEPKGVIERILEDDGIMMVMIGVIGVSLLAIVIMASVMIVGKKKRKAMAAAEVQPEQEEQEVMQGEAAELPETEQSDEVEAEETEAEPAQAVEEQTEEAEQTLSEQE